MSYWGVLAQKKINKEGPGVVVSGSPAGADLLVGRGRMDRGEPRPSGSHGWKLGSFGSR